MVHKIQILMVFFVVFIFLATGCGDQSPIAKTKTLLIGNWTGSYSNQSIHTGIIQLNFFEKNGELKVTYDLQNGEIVGTSTVSLHGRSFSFLGTGTKLRNIRGDVSSAELTMTGKITIDYTLDGTRFGDFELTKI